MKKFVLAMLVFGLVTVAFTAGTRAETSAETSGNTGLVALLTDQLGVTDKQAAGGAGALFEMAKNQLSDSEFGKVSKALPGIGGLMQAAPDTSPDTSNATGGLKEKMEGAAEGLKSVSDAGKSLNKLATVQNQFSRLGLDTGMVSQFIPVILDYANSKGGKTVMNLLASVWK